MLGLGGAREAPVVEVVVRAADRRRGEDGCELRNTPVVVVRVHYAASLIGLLRFEEAKSLLSKATPVARRALGEDHIRTLKLRWSYSMALFEDPAATRDNLREAVSSLEELERTARRVFGDAHPTKKGVEISLQNWHNFLYNSAKCAFVVTIL